MIVRQDGRLGLQGGSMGHGCMRAGERIAEQANVEDSREGILQGLDVERPAS